MDHFARIQATGILNFQLPTSHFHLQQKKSRSTIRAGFNNCKVGSQIKNSLAYNFTNLVDVSPTSDVILKIYTPEGSSEILIPICLSADIGIDFTVLPVMSKMS